MENVTERNNGYMPQRAKGECPAAMDGLKTGMLCCLLDEDLTFQWGNSSFFDSIGYTRESFFGCFRDLRQYYADYPRCVCLYPSGIGAGCGEELF